MTSTETATVDALPLDFYAARRIIMHALRDQSKPEARDLIQDLLSTMHGTSASGNAAPKPAGSGTESRGPGITS